MDRVLFDVDDTIAKKWRFTSTDKKKEITSMVNIMLKSALEKADDDFWEFMDRIGKKAVANGLTEEELNKILNEE